MNASDSISQYFTILAPQTPVLVAVITALVIVILKWRVGSRGSFWALLGLLLWLGSVLCIPAVSVAIRTWADSTNRSYFFTASGVFWSFVRAASFVFLLVAVFAGRPRPSLSSRASVPPAPR